MKIFVINLEKDKDRLDHIENEFGKRNLDWERIEAVYGKNLNTKDYNTNLSPSQLGCFLSFVKCFKRIVVENLPFALVVEDDITLSEWFDKLLPSKENKRAILKKLPKDFDVCWIGNSRSKWPRNPCSLIPDYDYDKLEMISKFIYKVDGRSADNYPMGTYGILVSNKGAKKILADHKNFYKEPFDVYLVKHQLLEKYMTVPSAILHCYDFGTNIGDYTESKINPFENVWEKFPIQEKEILNTLEQLDLLLNKNNINYSIIDGTLLGFARNKKLISYDDDLDIILDLKDVSKLDKILNKQSNFNFYKFEEPILNGGLYYKIFPKNNSLIISKEYKYSWPFIDIFVYEKKEEKSWYHISNEKQYEGSVKTFHTNIYSHNGIPYKTRVFQNFTKILDDTFSNWKNVCVSSLWNHMKEKTKNEVIAFNCKNIVPDYQPFDNIDAIYKHMYNRNISKKTKEKRNDFYFITIIAIFTSIVLTGLCLKKYFRK